MLGITPFGWLHTIISLIAVASGIISFIRYGAILWATKIGRTYVYTTILTCLTGFFIFHHGGFGKPHALGIITLIVLSTALAASYPRRYRIHDQASCWRTAGVRS